MRRNRTGGFAVLAVVVCACSLFQADGVARAAAKSPFTWSKYTSPNDGKDYDSPQWTDRGGGKRVLFKAQGWLNYPQTPTVTKVVMKIYRQGSQPGTWSATPAITYTMNPAPTFTGTPINAWLLSGIDPGPVLTEFDEGEQIKIVWEITTTDANGVETTDTIDQVVTVAYH